MRNWNAELECGTELFRRSVPPFCSAVLFRRSVPPFCSAFLCYDYAISERDHTVCVVVGEVDIVCGDQQRPVLCGEAAERLAEGAAAGRVQCGRRLVHEE